MLARGLRKLGALGALRRPAPASAAAPLQRGASAVRVTDDHPHTHPPAHTHAHTHTHPPAHARPWDNSDVTPWRPGGKSAWEGVWGSSSNPVPIASEHSARVVACGGEPSRPPHDLVWITVRRGVRTACPVCKQVFMLTKK